MTDYDTSHFDPPAPVTHVILRNPQSGATVSDVVLLLDMGSDVTLLPSSTVEQLGISIRTDPGYELMGFDGSRSLASVVTLDMVFLTRVFRGQYLLIEAERGILGRDILNHVSLLFNGPQQEWSEFPS